MSDVRDSVRDKLIHVVFSVYRILLARKQFYNLNKLLFLLSLRGMGILNFGSGQVTGEDSFLQRSFTRFVSQKEGLTVFDVGANEGGYASKVKRIYPTARVHAFEPHPRTFERLELKAFEYEFQAHNLACGREAGYLKLYDYSGAEERGTSHASLHKDVIGQIHKSESMAWNVQVIDLDHFIEEREIQKVHLLKVDTEGHDLNVIQGAQDSITRGIIDVIQFEFNEMNVVSRAFLKDFYDILPHYVFFRMLPGSLAPLGRYVPLTWEIFGYQNIVAVPQRCLSE